MTAQGSPAPAGPGHAQEMECSSVTPAAAAPGDSRWQRGSLASVPARRLPAESAGTAAAGSVMAAAAAHESPAQVISDTVGAVLVAVGDERRSVRQAPGQAGRRARAHTHTQAVALARTPWPGDGPGSLTDVSLAPI